MENPDFPARVGETPYGVGLFATLDLEPDTAVAQFDGEILPYAAVSEDDRRYALLLVGDEWLVDRTNARYLNHSCEANCRIAEDCTVYTTRNVAAGTELTISYDKISAKDLASGRTDLAWDDRWSFDCRCGSPRCRLRIDRYRILDESTEDVREKRTYLAWTADRGRGVFAGEAIRAGELIERAPAIVVPADQWVHLEKTALFDYSFAWGDELEHAAISGGYGSIYNHSYSPNAVYYKRIDDLFIDFIAIRDIGPGEEITINYNGDCADGRPLWFPVVGAGQ